LSPVAAVAFGERARALAVRLLALDESHRERLTASVANAMLIVGGDAADLPWIDGILYLGVDAEAPELLLPTTSCPSVPVDLFARAITSRFKSQPRPLAVVHDPPSVIPLGALRRIDRGALQKWLERAS
jgi:hypothetical protein